MTGLVGFFIIIIYHNITYRVTLRYPWCKSINQLTVFVLYEVFYTNGLMRMRLTPDVRKMVISTLYGYLVVIHDLDLSSMSKDLAGQSLSKLSAVLWIRIL